MESIERVKLLLNKHNLTQKKFAISIGISPARLNNYFAVLSKMPLDLLIRISESYNVNLHWLITGEGDMFNPVPTSSRPLDPSTSQLISIPVVAPIAAGAPLEVIDQEPLEILHIPASLLHLPPPYFAFKVEGESMSPFILDGDTVVLSRNWRGLKLNGRICGFRTPDGITLKKLVLQPQQKTAWLMPLNHSYDPVPYNKDTEYLSLFGVLVLSIRRYL